MFSFFYFLNLILVYKDAIVMFWKYFLEELREYLGFFSTHGVSWSSILDIFDYSRRELIRHTRCFCLLTTWVSLAYSIFSLTHGMSWLGILGIFAYSWRELVCHIRYAWLTHHMSLIVILSSLDLLITWVTSAYWVVQTVREER